MIDMTIGSISGAYNRGYINPADRAGAVSGRRPVAPVPAIEGTERGAGSGVLSPPADRANLAGLYYSRDGDRAEISNDAMALLRDAAKDDGPTILSEYDLNLPSPFIDWPQSPPEIAAPPAPGAVPPDGALPAMGAPADAQILDPAMPGFAPQGIAPPAASPPDSAGGPDDAPKLDGAGGIEPAKECKTCASRKYVDQSDDPSVSFQTPTNLSPGTAAAAVAAHEQEHVRHERSDAKRDNREIIHQSVTLTYDCCPECGRSYVSGGTTRTTSIGKSEPKNAQADNNQPGNGSKDVNG